MTSRFTHGTVVMRRLRATVGIAVVGIVASAGFAAAATAFPGGHDPTGWTTAHYQGTEGTAEDVAAYWSFEEDAQDGVVLAQDQSGGGVAIGIHIEVPLHGAKANGPAAPQPRPTARRHRSPGQRGASPWVSCHRKH